MSVRTERPTENWHGTDDESRALDNKILRGSAWIALSYGGRSVLSLISTLVLVHLVEPAAFGLVALASTVILLVNQVQGAGLSSAVIYHRDELEERAGTAALLIIVSSLVLFGVAFFAAPLVGHLFHSHEVTSVFRVLSGVLVLNAISKIPAALLERDVSFNLRARVELSGAFAQFGVAVGTAAIGWGVWALVAGQLTASMIQAVGNWVLVPWRPDMRKAKFRHIRPLVRYGRYVTASNMLNIVNNTIDNAMIGRLLGTASLGFYAITFRLADFPNTVIGYIVGRVMFPVYAILQGNIPEFRRTYVQNLQRVALLAFPVSVTLAVAAEPIVIGILGEKWRPVIEPLRILAIYGFVKSLTAPAGEVFKGIGRPRVNFLTGILFLAVAAPALVLLVPRFGLDGAAISMLSATVAAGFTKLGWSLKALDLSVGKLFAALAPSALCSAILGIALAILQLPTGTLDPAVALILIVLGGLAAYVAAAAVFARGIVGPVWVSLRGTR